MRETKLTTSNSIDASASPSMRSHLTKPKPSGSSTHAALATQNQPTTCDGRHRGFASSFARRAGRSGQPSTEQNVQKTDGRRRRPCSRRRLGRRRFVELDAWARHPMVRRFVRSPLSCRPVLSQGHQPSTRKRMRDANPSLRRIGAGSNRIRPRRLGRDLNPRTSDSV